MAGLSDALGFPEMEQDPQETSSDYSLWHLEVSSPLASSFVCKLREMTQFIPRALVTDVTQHHPADRDRGPTSHLGPGPPREAPPAWCLGASSS